MRTPGELISVESSGSITEIAGEIYKGPPVPSPFSKGPERGGTRRADGLPRRLDAIQAGIHG